ncbi:hypothetical protein [Megasphaera stantonii]|uniref:hypothetical protein n=1 Tax=Megasphaera stantonii TaxID=2144175 RepID=UPI00195DAA40|nr:hypothetical protein [Megasphaera stantonii]MBM6732580.1 hypothetical protein [Megasphaera stantonii]
MERLEDQQNLHLSISKKEPFCFHCYTCMSFARDYCRQSVFLVMVHSLPVHAFRKRFVQLDHRRSQQIPLSIF